MIHIPTSDIPALAWPFLLFVLAIVADLIISRRRYGVRAIYPPIVTWYFDKFPRKAYLYGMGLCVIAGFVLTVLKVSPAIPTYLLCGMFAAVAPVHVVVWYKKRKIEKMNEV